MSEPENTCRKTVTHELKDGKMEDRIKWCRPKRNKMFIVLNCWESRVQKKRH